MDGRIVKAIVEEAPALAKELAAASGTLAHAAQELFTANAVRSTAKAGDDVAADLGAALRGNKSGKIGDLAIGRDGFEIERPEDRVGLNRMLANSSTAGRTVSSDLDEPVEKLYGMRQEQSGLKFLEHGTRSGVSPFADHFKQLERSQPTDMQEMVEHMKRTSEPPD